MFFATCSFWWIPLKLRLSWVFFTGASYLTLSFICAYSGNSIGPESASYSIFKNSSSFIYVTRGVVTIESTSAIAAARAYSTSSSSLLSDISSDSGSWTWSPRFLASSRSLRSLSRRIFSWSLASCRLVLWNTTSFLGLGFFSSRRASSSKRSYSNLLRQARTYGFTRIDCMRIWSS